MGANSAIQWTDATYNVAIGCSKVSPGCKFCYMMRDFEGRFNKEVNGKVTRTKAATFNLPLKWQRQGLKAPDGRPLKVFTSSLTDLFHPAIDSYRSEVWAIMKQCPDLIFQVLTKRPERINDCLPEDWAEGYPNVWLGVSVEDNERMHRIETLAGIECKVRFVSFEPLLEAINVTPYFSALKATDWAIIGGESGNEKGKYRYRECEIGWLVELVDELEWHSVPVFVKQLGTHLSKTLELQSRHGGDISEFPEALQLRQFPHAYEKTN